MSQRTDEPVGTPSRGREPISPSEARAIARLKVTVDRRRGRETPAWIVELAES